MSAQGGVVPYELGLHEIADGVYAYLQPDGSWGYSNAGLVAGDGSSVLIDTLFDLQLTGAMLAAMEPVTATCPISTIVNTHANGDHCYGNQLLAGVRVVSSDDTAHEMAEVPASLLHSLKGLDLGAEGNAFVSDAFGPFDFAGIDVPPPTETFRGTLDLEIGGRPVELIEVGPAHTGGDVIVHVPDARTVFTGDILFIGSTPIVWAGPVENWLRACDRIRAVEPEVVIPGHGPVATVEALQPLEDYLRFVHHEASVRAAAGMSALDAAFDIDLGEFAAWLDPERIVITVDAVYAELVAGHRRMDSLSMMQNLGRYRLSCRRPEDAASQ